MPQAQPGGCRGSRASAGAAQRHRATCYLPRTAPSSFLRERRARACGGLGCSEACSATASGTRAKPSRASPPSAPSRGRCSRICRSRHLVSKRCSAILWVANTQNHGLIGVNRRTWGRPDSKSAFICSTRRRKAVRCRAAKDLCRGLNRRARPPPVQVRNNPPSFKPPAQRKAPQRGALLCD